MMRFVIWGAGSRGTEILNCLDRSKVDAFIDMDDKKIATCINEVPVISYEEYEKKFSSDFIIISTLIYEDDVENFLMNKNNYNFFALTKNPQEILGRGTQSIFDNLPFDFDKSLKNYVYGSNLFAVLLFENLLSKDCNAYLVPDKNCNAKKIAALEKIYSSRVISTINNDVVSNIFFTENVDKNFFSNRHHVFDCFDFSYQIKQYYHPELEKFKNCHKGERCFIVATGPSLRVADLDVLDKHKEISFSMNMIYESFDKTNWRPKFYFVSDDLCFSQNCDKINSLEIENVFIANNTDVLKNTPANKRFYRFHSDNSSYKFIGRKFSEDVCVCTYSYHSVIHIALQFAVYMGFTEIYLLGADCTFNKSKNHFYANEPKKKYQSDQKNFFEGYETLKEYADAHGIKVYNATRGGALEIFPRVDFDNLFEN